MEGFTAFRLSGTIHKPVFLHLWPVSTTLPLYRTSTLIPYLVNDTSQPALHNFTTEMSEYLSKPGRMCANLAACGSSGRSKSPVWVLCILSPSGSDTLMGCCAGFLLTVGALMTRKWLVAHESNTAHSCMLSRLMSTVLSSALAAYANRALV